MITRSDLLEKIRIGDDGFLELKEVRFAGGKLRGPSQDDIADELAAFANSSGGVLVLGVQDKSRDVIGIAQNNLDAVETLLVEACEQSIKPSLAPIIEKLTLPDSRGIEQPVIRVEVSKSIFVHQSPGGYLQRIGFSKRPIAPDQLARLFQVRSQSRMIRFDETPVSSASMSYLDESLWMRFAPQRSDDEPEILLGKLAMAAQDFQGQWRPTVAGLLMGSHGSQKFLPGAFIQAVAYYGHEARPVDQNPYQSDAQDITGSLDKQIIDACHFVRKNMKVAAIKRVDGGREDLPQFDMLSVFEAVTNAVAHRDYSMAGAKVRLRLFDDRLEIYCPGMLTNTMTPESLPFRQAVRNEALTSLLGRCPIDNDAFLSHRQHFMDKRGEGVPIILANSEKLSGKRPQYRMIDDSELQLTIYAAQIPIAK